MSSPKSNRHTTATSARRVLLALLPLAVLGASCEIEAADPETGAPIIERRVGSETTTTTTAPAAEPTPDGPIPGTLLSAPPHLEAPPEPDPEPDPVVPMPTTPTEPDDGDDADGGDAGDGGDADTSLTIMWADNNQRTEPDLLDTATIDEDLHVFAVPDGQAPVRLEWMINGSVYRDDDLYAPYDLVPEIDGLSGRLPIDQLGGGTHVVTAVAVLATSDGSETGTATEWVAESASFTVDAPAIPSPTTTAPPATPTTTVPAPTTTTAPAPTGVPACAPQSAATVGWRGAGLSEGDLTPMTGPIVLRDGDVLENFDVTGHIEIAGDNVVVRNGRVRGTADTPHWGGLIDVRGDNALIEFVELDGAGEAGNGVYVHDDLGGGYTARHLDLHGLSADAFKVLGPTVLEGIYAHDRNPLVTSAHSDVIQLQNWRSDGSLTVRCSNMDWGIPDGYSRSQVTNGSISGGQGIWIADYWLQNLEIRDSRVIAVGYTLGLRVDTRLVMCNVQVGSDMGWGGIHPGFGTPPASTVAWSVTDADSGAAIGSVAPTTTGC